MKIKEANGKIAFEKCIRDLARKDGADLGYTERMMDMLADTIYFVFRELRAFKSLCNEPPIPGDEDEWGKSDQEDDVEGEAAVVEKMEVENEQEEDEDAAAIQVIPRGLIITELDIRQNIYQFGRGVRGEGFSGVDGDPSFFLPRVTRKYGGLIKPL